MTPDPFSFPRWVRDRLNGRLPGVEAQARLSPRGRPRKSDVEEIACKEAGVLALLHPISGNGGSTNLHGVILIERPGHLSKHAGQVAFPGGRREEGESRRQAALRETEEEIGVDRGRIELLGALTPLYIPPSGFCVYPFVGWVPETPEMTLEPGEVAAAFSVPLTRFVDGPTETVEIERLSRRVPAFLVEGRTIWGATAMMLSELAEVLEPMLPAPAARNAGR